MASHGSAAGASHFTLPHLTRGVPPGSPLPVSCSAGGDWERGPGGTRDFRVEGRRYSEILLPGRRLGPCPRAGATDREIDELAAAEETFPVIVALALGDDQGGGVGRAGRPVAGDELGRVLLQGD